VIAEGAMTADQFDSVLAALARARSRREMFAALAVATVAGSAALDAAPAAAVCRGRNERCKQKRECCSERCRSRKGKKRRKCACTEEGERCLETADCCKGDVRLLCVSGFCVRDR
jgi:hypothetical protein